MSDEEKSIRVTEDEIDLPLVNILAGRGFITGKSGSGKSNTAGKICEEILEEGYPLMVIDTEGEYYGLKEEYELLHVGADEECDLQVGPEHSQKIAELALEENVPIILDVSGYIDQEEANKLVYRTTKALFDKEKKMKKPFPILVEEAREWIPQSGKTGEDGEVSDMLIRIAKRGRKRGLGITAVSQRPAAVDKNYITQTDLKIWHKVDYPSDIEVVKDVLGKDYVDSVKNLETGQGIFQSDFLDESPLKAKFLKKETFDAGETPDLGDFERPELKSVSSDLVGELQEISEQKKKEKNRIEQLEEQLEKKEDEIQDLEEDLERAQDMSDMAEQFTQAMASGGSSEVEEKVDEIKNEKNEKIRELENEKKSLQDKVDEINSQNQELRQQVTELKEHKQASENIDDLREAVIRMSEALGLEADSSGSEKLKKKLKSKDERIDELEAKISKLQEQGYSLDEEFSDKMDFLKHNAVREEIDTAIGKVSISSDNAWDILSVLVDSDDISMNEIGPYVDVGRTSISKVLARLQEHDIVSVSKDGQTNLYSLNVNGMKDIIETQKKRSEMKNLKNKVKGE